MKWEYRIVPARFGYNTEKEERNLEDKLNELGQLGFDIIKIDPERIYLKRKIEEDSNREWEDSEGSDFSNEFTLIKADPDITRTLKLNNLKQSLNEFAEFDKEKKIQTLESAMRLAEYMFNDCLSEDLQEEFSRLLGKAQSVLGRMESEDIHRQSNASLMAAFQLVQGLVIDIRKVSIAI